MLPSIFSGQADSDNTAILALADGTCFRGVSVGADGVCTAELVFNTLLAGHQEAITDPSYSGQIIAFTYPHIGSTGVNNQDSQSSQAQVSGLVMRDCSLVVSNFRATQSLPDYLKQQGVVAIAGIDTRKLTRIIRERGKQAACIMVGNNADEAVSLARQFSQEQGSHAVAPEARVAYSQSEESIANATYNVVVYDFGVKFSALNALANRGCKVHVVAPNTPAAEILKLKPHGLFLSSGPGNPNSNPQYIKLVSDLINLKLPTLAVGLGMQLVAKSQGASIEALNTGSHGDNHPIRSSKSGRVFISSQKQEFAVSHNNLPSNINTTYVSLFDGTIQGIELTDAPVVALQPYPEANPGPSDLNYIFDQFINQLITNK